MAELLILAEMDGAQVAHATRAAIAFAQEFKETTGGEFDLLIAGPPGSAAQAADWSGFGATRIWTLESAELEHPTADRMAAVCLEAMKQSQSHSLAAAATTFGRDTLPRAASLLDLPMLSDLLKVSLEGGRPVFRRPMYAGNLIATVQIAGDAGVFSIRAAAYGAPTASASQSEVVALTPGSAPPSHTIWQGLESSERKRPDLEGARVVVSGGRPLGNAETFERLVGGLADRLGGAVGATRAAVDSGIAPNELQVGQTGKIVAPELYIAAGISGSVQHLAGMKESKVIVAINTDPDAPIFEVADYGLVADLHTALPELTARI